MAASCPHIAASGGINVHTMTTDEGDSKPRELTLEERRKFELHRRMEDPLYYGSYLQLEKILGANQPISRALGKEAQ
jgi:hypothetical protein